MYPGCQSFLDQGHEVRRLVRFIQLGPGATVTLRALFGHRNGGERIFDEEVEMYSNSLLSQLTENNIGKVKLSIYSFGRPTRSWSKNGCIVLTLDLVVTLSGTSDVRW